MKQLITKTLKNEDWVIVIIGFFILAYAFFLPEYLPSMPKKLSSTENWIAAAEMFAFVAVIIYVANLSLGKSIRGILPSLLVIFTLALCANAIAAIPIIKEYGIETVFFSVVLGLIIRNVFHVPSWLLPAVQSEFYIKIGIICLGSTILFTEVMKSGVYGMMQSLIVVFAVWNFAFWISRKLKIDGESSTMLSSAVSICGVSAAIATCGVIKGDNKKLSYIISLVLVCAIPMMYLMPYLAELMGLNQDVAGAWLGGTIDTTGAVAASGTMLGEEATQTAIIVKSSQNVLLGVAAFAISLYWTYRGREGQEKPTLGLIWSRFPKFVVGFIVASLVFSFFMDTETAKSIGKLTKGMTNALFGIAFVCIGLETRLKDIISRENRKTLWAFLTAQVFNIIITLIVAYVMFDVLKD
ncbi:MAG: putative sulfate exporter family transporter [Flavobacteriales bacterium]|nr:putative sulfate exporter family transporter [Flavobacteriales bacterium]